MTRERNTWMFPNRFFTALDQRDESRNKDSWRSGPTPMSSEHFVALTDQAVICSFFGALQSSPLVTRSPRPPLSQGPNASKFQFFGRNRQNKTRTGSNGRLVAYLSHHVQGSINRRLEDRCSFISLDRQNDAIYLNMVITGYIAHEPPRSAAAASL